MVPKGLTSDGGLKFGFARRFSCCARAAVVDCGLPDQRWKPRFLATFCNEAILAARRITAFAPVLRYSVACATKSYIFHESGS